MRSENLLNSLVWDTELFILNYILSTLQKFKLFIGNTDLVHGEGLDLPTKDREALRGDYRPHIRHQCVREYLIGESVVAGVPNVAQLFRTYTIIMNCNMLREIGMQTKQKSILTN